MKKMYFYFYFISFYYSLFDFILFGKVSVIFCFIYFYLFNIIICLSCLFSAMLS